MKRPNGRALIYPLIVVPILAVAVFAVTLCMRAGEVPSALVNSRVVGWFANRVGVQYSIGSLHFGCYQADCNTLVDLSGLSVSLPEVGELQISLDSIHWCAVHPLTVHGLNVRATGFPAISVGELDFVTDTRAADIRDIRLERETGPPLTVRRIATSPAVSNAKDNRLVLDQVDIAGVEAVLGGSDRAANLCARTQSIFRTGDELGALAQSGRAWFDRVISRTRRDLLYLSLITPAVLLILKLLATSWMKRRVGLILTVTSVALPFVIYLLFRNNLSTRSLIADAFAASMALAVASWAFHYRKAIRGYQRWEPFTIDLACFLIVLPLIGYNVDFNPRVEAPSNVAVGRINITESSLAVNASRCGEDQVINTSVPALTVDNLNVQLPNPTQRMTTIQIANVELPVLAVDVPNLQLSDLSAGLTDVHFALDGNARRLQDLRAGFRVNGTALSAGANPIQFVADSGSVALVPQYCDFSYGADLRVVTRPLGVAAALAGDSKGVRVRKLRTLPGSVVQIDDGSGTLSFAGDLLTTLRLSSIAANVGSSQVRVASADVSAKAPGLCTTGGQTIALAVNGADVEGAGGWNAQIAQSQINFSRGVTGKTSGTLVFADARLANSTTSIVATVPTFRAALAGTTTGAVVPRAFNGDVTFRAGSGNDIIAGNDAPLGFSLDFRNGALWIPLQSQVLRQTAFADLPNEIPLRLSASGRFRGNVDAFIHVPRLALPVGPLQAELNDLEFNARMGRIDFKTAWNRISLPSVPRTLCLEEISQLTLSTVGQLAGFVFPDLPAPETVGNVACASLPTVPPEEQFRVEGAVPPLSGQPAIRLETNPGGPVEIRAVQSSVRKLDLTGGRLQSLELDSESSGIRIGNRAEESASKIHISLSDGATKLASTITDSKSNVIEWSVVASPGRVHADVLQRERLNHLIADASFDGPELARLDADVHLGAGPLASTRDLTVSTGDSTIKLNLERDALNVNADVSQLSFNRRDDAGAVLSGRLDLNTELRGKFYRDGVPSMSRVMAMTSSVVRSLAKDYRQAFPARATTLNWDFSLTNSQKTQPLLHSDGDRIGLRMAANVRNLAASAVNARGQMGLEGDLRIHDGELVADAYAPIHITTSGLPEVFNRIDLNLPVLAVLSDSLRPGRTPEHLWDADYYETFWSGYPIDQASRGDVALFDDPRLPVGPVSLREFVAPLQTFRLAIGHSGGIGVHAPLSARLLHGTAAGFFDAALSWPRNEISLDTRASLSLRNIQAGALGFDAYAGYLPLLEHELDGDISVSTTGWPLTLNASSFGVDVRTSSRETQPGFFQFRNGVTVNTLNQILDKVVRDIQFKVPPTSGVFRTMALKINVDHGKLKTDTPWLTLKGLKLLSSNDLILESNIRLHGTRNGEAVDFRDLLGTFQMVPLND